MGLFRKKGRERVIRADYRALPSDKWTEDEWAHYDANLSDDEYWAEWEVWSRETVEHRTVKRIRRGALDLAREAARSGHPKEFGCLLRVVGDTITDVLLMPGTFEGEDSVLFNLWMQPVERSIKGSLHSHPDAHPYPSDADFELFEKHGTIHLILCEPYGRDDWRAYAHDGTPVSLKVVA